VQISVANLVDVTTTTVKVVSVRAPFDVSEAMEKFQAN
jgi:hypothetical protein